MSAETKYKEIQTSGQRKFLEIVVEVHVVFNRLRWVRQFQPVTSRRDGRELCNCPMPTYDIKRQTLRPSKVYPDKPSDIEGS